MLDTRCFAKNSVPSLVVLAVGVALLMLAPGCSKTNNISVGGNGGSTAAGAGGSSGGQQAGGQQAGGQQAGGQQAGGQGGGMPGGSGGQPAGGTLGGSGTVCGNGIKEAAEECDGPFLGGATCATETAPGAGGDLKCLDDCTFDTSQCIYCGDGKRNNAEQCDGADLGGVTCQSVLGQPDAEGTPGCDGSCKLVTSSCSSCLDGKKDGDETGSDCGGSCLARCPLGEGCLVDSDCADNRVCAEGTCSMNRSCAGLAPTCGLNQSEDCCQTAKPVEGGAFFRSYDGINFKDMNSPATVSTFLLDRYEVTVGRFRKFVAATVAGWKPVPGSGKHTHLNAGKGLNGGTEPGWDALWPALPTSESVWGDPSHLSSDPIYRTWTPSPDASHENLPINSVSWYEAYAFCIWDGGFLPTEAEWNYAAAGGAEQRSYPWSAKYPPGSTIIEEAHASYGCKGDGSAGCAFSDIRVPGSYSTEGDGLWGQADLTGNLFEWCLDSFVGPYPASCDDCADLTSSAPRSVRGGYFEDTSDHLLSAFRGVNYGPTERRGEIGFRCARTSN